LELFWPELLVVEDGALDYAMGREAYDRLRREGVPVEHLPASGRSASIAAAKTPKQYQRLKKVLVLAVEKLREFESCKPSAEFHLPLAGGCPGACQYCYLASTYEMRPFVRLYVNLEEILQKAGEEIRKAAPQLTRFEGSSKSDTLSVEHIGGSLARCITFFGQEEHGRFRFVSKFDNVAGLLPLAHNGHTKIRFSINAAYVIRQFEQHTASLDERIAAARKVADAGYPLGLIVAPLMRFDGWAGEYAAALDRLGEGLGPHASGPITFELIQHRFTPKAKRVILSAYPKTRLPLDEAARQFKAGKFKHAGKYVYRKEEATELALFMEMAIRERFPHSSIEYFT
jgi:spore photoproduct lyase